MKEERLDKLLCLSGAYTRSQARAVIRAGVVTVGGAAVREPEKKVPAGGEIRVRGEVLDTAETVYYMMNKPAGYISGAKDELYPAVTGLLPPALRKRGLFCVGRLDADVTGLLLLTDDGSFAHRVTSPKAEIEKTYEVLLDGAVTEGNAAALAQGVTLSGGTHYRPARLEPDRENASRARVTVTEGKYHEVKNLMAFCGRQVLEMRRVSIGALTLDETLKPGELRRLTEAEAALVFGKTGEET